MGVQNISVVSKQIKVKFVWAGVYICHWRAEEKVKVQVQNLGEPDT